jgi:hypothetical protein
VNEDLVLALEVGNDVVGGNGALLPAGEALHELALYLDLDEARPQAPGCARLRGYIKRRAPV